MIDAKQFELVLQTISMGLVAKIVADTGLDEDVAIEQLYSSRLYEVLEREDTKVWHYSVHKLFDLWDEEMRTGQLVLPEY